MKKDQSSIVRQAILELAAEDFYGLWELSWRLAELLRVPEGHVVDVVRRELAELVREQEIAFYLRSRLEDDPVSVAADHLDWRSAVTFRPPESGEPQVLISIPDSPLPSPSATPTDPGRQPPRSP